MKHENNNSTRIITARDYLALLAGTSLWFIYIFQTKLYLRAAKRILYFINYLIATPVFYFCSAAFIFSIILNLIHVKLNKKITRILRFFFLGLFVLYAIGLLLSALGIIVPPNIGFNIVYNWFFLFLGCLFAFSINNN